MNQPTHDPNLGRVLGGHYRVDQLLGRGGMGAVYRGLQISVGRAVAIKLVSGGMPDPALSLQRFRREAEATGRLNHPHTIRLFDFGLTEQGEVYMVMELLEGCDLAARLQSGPLPADEAFQIMRQVLLALSEAHAHGIIHRDLKPGNIFLSRVHGSDSFVKVMDFGIAGIEAGPDAQKLTVTGAVMGTPAYMSPEQAQGKPVDPRSDLYSCGVVLFEMLAGRTPFEAETLVSMLLAHVTQPPKRLADFGVLLPNLDQVQTLIDSMLAKSPTGRPGSAEHVIQMLDALLPDAAISGTTRTLNSTPPHTRTLTRTLTQAAQPTSSGRAAVPDVAVTPVAWDSGASAPSRARQTSSARGLWLSAGATAVIALALGAGLLMPKRPDVVAPSPTPASGANVGNAREISVGSAPPSIASQPASINAAPPRAKPSKEPPPAAIAAEQTTGTSAAQPAAEQHEAKPSRNDVVDVVDDDASPEQETARGKLRGRIARTAAERRAARRRAGSHTAQAEPEESGESNGITDTLPSKPTVDAPAEPAATSAGSDPAPTHAKSEPTAAPAGADDVLRRAPPFPSISAAKRAQDSGKISTAAYEAAVSSLKARRARRIDIEQKNLAQGTISPQEYEWRLGRIDQEYRGE